MEKHYYATGNGGSGTSVYAFDSKQARDYFVGWNSSFDQRRTISRNDARRYGSQAALLVDGCLVPDGYGPKQIAL